MCENLIDGVGGLMKSFFLGGRWDSCCCWMRMLMMMMMMIPFSSMLCICKKMNEHNV